MVKVRVDFTFLCSTMFHLYLLCTLEERECARHFFVTLRQFVTLKTSSLTSCIFPVGMYFRNPSWLNIVVGDAVLVVCPYVYMAKCAIKHLVVVNLRMCNNPVFLERTFRYFLHSEFTRRRFIFGWWGTSLSVGALSSRFVFETTEVVADDVEAREVVDVLADDGFFLLNISAMFWECLAARF